MQMNETATIGDNDPGSTVVINHRVRECHRPDYEQWLNEIVPACNAADGFLDWNIVRPIDGQTHTYTFIIRFASKAYLRGWMESDVRNELIDKVQPLLVAGDDIYVSSGLDFWFTPAEAKAALPVRWKQFLVTWSAIYPLVMLTPLAVVPLLRLLGLPQNYLFETLVITGLVVFVMIYIVMPRFTRLLQRWLFR